MSADIKPVAWYCTRSVDGQHEAFREPFLATNEEYVKAHKGYDWTPLYGQVAIDALTAALDRIERLAQELEGVKHQRYVAACIRGAMRGDDMAEQAEQTNLRD